jgi:hypothetical protein
MTVLSLPLFYIEACKIPVLINIYLPFPVAARSKAWVCGPSLAMIAGSKPTGGGAWMSVSRECCVLSGRGLCFGPITRPEEYYRVWCV